MDTLAHALYGATIVAHTLDEKKMLVAATMGMMPDLIVYGVYLAKGHIPPFVPAESVNLYHYTHSLFVPALLWLLLPKKWRVFAIPYALHIFLDIPTHCGLFATKFLFPLSNFSTCGFNYADHWWAWELNYGLIILIFYIIYARCYKPLLKT